MKVTTTKKRLPPYLAKQRKEIFYKIWQETKGNLTMTELAKVLNFPLDRLFKILKEQNKKKNAKI